MLNLQLLQNIVYIPCAVQCILEAVSSAVVYASCSPTPFVPLPLLTTSCLYLWVSFFFIIFTTLSCFLDSAYEWHHTVYIILCRSYVAEHNVLQAHMDGLLQMATLHSLLWLSNVPLYLRNKFALSFLCCYTLRRFLLLLLLSRFSRVRLYATP